MALLDEGLGSKVLPAAGLVASVLLFRSLARALPPSLRSAAEAGMRIFAEAEFDMQDGIIGELADHAVEALLDNMPDDKDRLGPAVLRIIHGYENRARSRSARHAWNERDRSARYRHHVRKLKAAVEEAAHDLPPAQQQYLAQASAAIAEDW